jgi:large repetitive protein
MGSYKSNGRNPRPGRRQSGGNDADRRRRQPILEGLEQRTLLDGGALMQNPPTWKPTNTNVLDVKNGPLAKAGQDLIKIYSEYQDFIHLGGNFNSSLSNRVEFKGTNVGVNVRGFGDFNAFVASLRNLGMQVVATNSPTGTVNGFLPIAELPAVAAMAQTIGLSPSYKPHASSVGVASNQSEQTLNAPAARTSFGVTGAGVTVGVLSDSANQFGGGLQASISTGDLPSTARVINDPATGQPEDGPAGSSDEGRAMMEQIYDIAPGTNILFATAFVGGPAGFAKNIRDLANAGSQVIVDDVAYADEPFFQDGIIQQAVTDVTNNKNVTYLSSAHNSANEGYLSQFRGTQATVVGVGTGRFMDYDPGAGVTTGLPVTINNPGFVAFQYDQPFYTTNGVISDVDIFAIDNTGTVVASGVTNNIATQQPIEFLDFTQTGNFTIVIRVTSGPDPGNVSFIDVFDQTGMVVSQQFGSAGGTFYPSTFGHAAGSETIGVGAVPWWNAAPFTNPNPITNEGFSSFGPQLFVFNADGTRKATPELRQKPDVSAPDGNDTTFFIPGLFLSTVNPPPGTGPATPTELDGNGFPNFFGTSSAAPNLAAVAALMKQFNPLLTKSDILSAFIASATPLNGAATGTWNNQGGFGLVDAAKALTAVDTLRVKATTPANNAALGSAPSTIVVTFTKAIDPLSINASNLVFTSTPTGVTARPLPSLAPTIINSTTVSYPIEIDSSLPNTKSNGTYSYTITNTVRAASNGQALTPLSASFSVSDVSAPKVTNVTFNGRIIVVQFSEAMRPSTINTSSIILERTGSSGVFNNPTNVILNNDPRMIVFYDGPNNRAIIDVSKLDQTSLPSDNYAVIVRDTATDQVGNHLDGEFSGIYPSGNGVEGGDFFLNLPNQQVRAPQIVFVRLTEPGDKNVTISDTGIPNDQNTKDQRATFTGLVTNTFPGTSIGISVVAQFNGLNNGAFTLNPGTGGRGFSGQPDASYVFATTDSLGRFTFQAPANLPDGFNTVRVVPVGAPDAPPLPGLSTVKDQSFRVDTSIPTVLSASIPSGAVLSSLTSISLNVTDPVLPSTPGPLAVPAQLSIPALDPQTANNISNYSLINLGPDRVLGGGDDRDLSNFITSANFVSTTVRVNSSDPYTGRIDLTFAPGLPAGLYMIVARTVGGLAPGITDAAGNPLDGFTSIPGLQHFSTLVNLQPEPAYITQLRLVSPTPTPNGGPVSYYGPRSYFELPSATSIERAPAPPNQIQIDFSNPLTPPLPVGSFDPNVGVNYNANAVQLIRSADSSLSAPDGDFGVDGATGFTRVAGTTVTLMNSIPGAVFGQPGYLNRLVLNLPPNSVLPADHYRILLPNTGANAIIDLFGNQVDGEFLGNPTALGSLPVSISAATPAPEPALQYEDLLPNGQYRAGLSGDGVAGGAFTTSFVVVPNGNVLYARPDYVDDRFLTADDPDGSLAKPYAALAPEAVANAANGGDLNSAANFGTGFDPAFDRNGNGRFDRSVFYAAQLASVRGPVVIVSLPGIVTSEGQATFVLQAPSGTDPVRNDGSASIPFDTSLVFAPGSDLKLQNATLFVQNQGTSLLVLGGPNPDQKVNFTSFKNDAVGGDTNGDGADSSPLGGDWGGIQLRNFDQRNRNSISSVFPIDGRLKGEGGTNPTRDAMSGADDALSAINFADISFAGGAVPLTLGPNRYDAITASNARPAITNVVITQTGGVNGSQAAISGDLDSFREDDVARGMLVRRLTMSANSINAILLRPQLGGTVEASNAIVRPNNPASLGGSQNYVLDDPYPYVLLTRMAIGQMQLVDTGGNEQNTANRLYIQPGMMIKGGSGGGIEVLSVGSSINIGDRTYIRGFDANSNYSPNDPNFRPPTVGDAKVLLTSFFDDLASTFYHDQNTGQDTIIVAPIDSDNGGSFLQPTNGNVDRRARWGGVTIDGGARAVIDEAVFQDGGGPLNLPQGTDPIRPVLSLFSTGFGNLGSRVYVTNNQFFDNLEAAIAADPNSMLAADPLRPLASGHPFFRGNIMQRNTYDALRIYALPSVNTISSPNPAGISEAIPAGNNVTQTVSAVWDATDLTYVLRGSIQVGNPFYNAPLPSGSTLLPEKRPSITLTIQSAAPDTLLANGQRIARPGESVLVKLLGFFDPAGDAVNGSTSDDNAGAGFQVGVDDGSDPPADPLIDSGLDGQIRIVGIPGNETTGQQRVPAIITSLFDATVGKTVGGVNMTDIFHPTNPNFDPRAFNPNGTVRTAPAPGDGGLIYFGALSLTDYNLVDPRDGNLIDNADIRYMTRIEIQGGGFIDIYDLNGDQAYDFNDDPRKQKLGIDPVTNQVDPLTQFNSSRAMTISNSNLSSFSQVGVLAHPGFAPIGRDVGPLGGFPGLTTPLGRVGAQGQPTDLYMVNSTVTNMPTGINVISQTGVGATFSNTDTENEPSIVLLLFNTFNNNATALSFTSPPGQTGAAFNPFSSVRWLAMGNIFSNSSTEAITSVGQPQSSQLQYNLFFGNASNLSVTNTGVIIFPAGGFGGNNGAIFGDPMFRSASTGDYSLLAGSAAIDAARSEIGPNFWANLLEPIAAQVLGPNGGVRNNLGRLGGLPGFGLPPTPPNQLVTLPGSGQSGFADEWLAVAPGTPGSLTGLASNAGTFNYVPILGERDQAGFLRIDNPATPNVGTGLKPFFDMGAFEFRQLNPPKVIADPVSGRGVTAIITDPNSPTGTQSVDIYSVGGIAGLNKSLQSIQITFSNRIDPNTLNNQTVLLQASGGDAIFGNGNSTGDKFIDLSGKLSFDSISHVLTIDARGLNLPNDEYRLTLQGTGGNVIRDPQGNALDGENTLNGSPNNPQLQLPTGDGVPGGNTFITFTIDTNPPSVIPGSVTLAPSSDSGARDFITNVTNPTFTGIITDLFPPAPAAVGETVIVDISTNGDGVFDRMNAGSAITTPVLDALGNPIPNQAQFSVTVTGAPLIDSPVKIGPSGKLSFSAGDLTGFSVARIRVVDQSGNSSNANDANATVQFVLDTKGPRVTTATPPPKTQATRNALGQVVVTATLNENLDPNSVNAGSVQIFRSGGDGIFGNGNDVQVTATSIVLSAPQPFTGAETITVTFAGTLPNDLYDVKLLGTGGSTVNDLATNPIDGEFTGTFPSGDGIAGGDFDLQILIFDPANSHLVFVGNGFTTNPGQAQGTRGNPFPTINAGIAAAQIGDIVAVLPGSYIESVVLKSLTKVISADPASTDTQFVAGTTLDTIVQAPLVAGTRAITVSGSNLLSIGTLDSEFAGFAVASPLNGNPATGPILTDSIGIYLLNSNALVDRNYVIDSGYGIVAATTGLGAVAPRIQNNGVMGNLVGILTNDNGNTQSITNSFVIRNNTIAFNTTGVFVVDTSPIASLIQIVNNIFWQNNDRSAARNGVAIRAVVPNKTQVAFNLFGPGNGPAAGNPGNITSNVGGSFDPALLSASPDSQGNFTGNPAFLSPRDPRPNADGPAVFLTDADFDLTFGSAAIDNALNSFAPTTDFLLRGRVNSGRGFPGHGPADIGAFEFQGTGGVAAGGAFRVTTANFASTNSIVVSFSQQVNTSTVSPTDLVLSGTGLDALQPARATSLSWIDNHTVKFILSGAFRSTGTVRLNIAQGAVTSSANRRLPQFTQNLTVSNGTFVPSASPTDDSGPSSGGPVLSQAATTVTQSSVPQTPAPAPSPTSSNPVALGAATVASAPIGQSTASQTQATKAATLRNRLAAVLARSQRRRA